MPSVNQFKVFAIFFLIVRTSDSSIPTQNDEGLRKEDSNTHTAATTRQLNCTTNPAICYNVCNEPQGSLSYSSTFCDTASGICVCDCRDSPRKDCEKTPFTPCFQNCVKKNPNPDVFRYEGGNCPMSRDNGTVSYQCACGCSIREDYDETNDI